MEDLIAPRARSVPSRTAVVADGETLDYARLDGAVDRAARRLTALGVGRGDRVAATLPPGLAFATLLHATARAGAVLAPLNTRLTAGERRAQLDQVAARLIVEEPLDGPEEAPRRGAAVRNGDEPWTLLFTSGTAGPPKPVLLSHRNHRASAAAAAAAVGVEAADRWLCVLPVFHVGGLATLVRAAAHGTAVALHERFDAAATAATIAAGRATLVSLVPTMLRRLLDVGLGPAPALRAILLGGAAAPAELLERALDAGLPVVRTYGMTETASLVATARAAPGGTGAGGAEARGALPQEATGARPLPGVGLRISARGEVLVRGAMVARGALADDGWLHTGDRGRLDEHGRLHVDGRLDDLIVTGGENVSPAEVERALLAHPAVVDAAVVGHPDPEWGQVVVAYVVTARPVGEDDLRAHCRRLLAGFKVPKRVGLVGELPRNAAGKLRRDALATLSPRVSAR